MNAVSFTRKQGISPGSDFILISNMKYVVVVLLIWLSLTNTNVYGQTQDSLSSRRLTTRQKIVIGGLAVQQVASFYVQYQWWWKNDYHKFNFEPDGFVNNYSLGVDKLGHFYTSYMYFHSLNEIMKWAKFSQRTRLITSTALPLAWAISIEIGDGFSSYGYSWDDLISNSLGIGLGALQERFPYMKNFKVKFSYYPSQYFVDNHFKGWSLTDDYRSHFYWLAFDVHNLLPKPAKRYWPAFLNIAVGYGVDKNTPRFGDPTNREFGISFDWNLSSIRTRNESVTLVKEIIDYIHFPAPGATKVQGQETNFKPILFR
jgi:hypothetical protein